MELGLKSLSDIFYSYQTTFNGQPRTSSGSWSMNKVCETWMQEQFDNDNPHSSADRFIKERLSLVEIGFRKHEDKIATANAAFPIKIQAAKNDALRPAEIGFIRVPGDRVEAYKSINAKLNDQFRVCVEELNTRFRQAGCSLNYHNGFIQLSTDELSLQQVETPFWTLVSNPKWENVDTDMKEALDRRDNDGRDPAMHATHALESTIKIVSDNKGWTHGGEKGAHNYIDNLASKKNGKFLTDWESESLKAIFTEVRNPFGHGPGSDEMPSLTPQQTDWAIETCMVWIKSRPVSQ